MNTEELKTWIKKNNVKERTLEGFWTCINNCIKDVEDDKGDILSSIDTSQINLEVKKISLAIIFDYSDFV